MLALESVNLRVLGRDGDSPKPVEDFRPYEDEEVEREPDLDFDKARLLQGFLIERYMHMRQGEELERQRAKALAEHQALRPSLTARKRKRGADSTGTSGDRLKNV